MAKIVSKSKKFCAKCGVELNHADNVELQTNRYPYECMVCANQGT